MHWQANHTLRHWSWSVWWSKRKLMLQLWNRKTKTVTVTRNLMLELKYDTVNKNKKIKKLIKTFPVGQATARPSKLPAPGSPYCHTLLYITGLGKMTSTWVASLKKKKRQPKFLVAATGYLWRLFSQNLTILTTKRKWDSLCWHLLISSTVFYELARHIGHINEQKVKKTHPYSP